MKRSRRTLATLILMLGMLSLIASPTLADGHGGHDHKQIKHSLFIAGPQFTGILDEDGKQIWSTRRGASDGFVLENGHVLIAWKNEVIEFDKNKKQVWTYKLDKSNKEISTAQRLDNGNTLVTELGKNPRLLEVAPDGSIAVEVKLQPDTDNGHMQTRMARKLPNGNYLVPHLFAFAVKEYTPAGKVVTKYPTDTDHFGGRATKHWPFTAIRTPGEPNNPEGTTVVGCTYGHRVVEFNTDGSIIWELTNNDLKEPLIKDACGVQRLPNGNTVITSYGQREDGKVKIFEVTPAKEVVWQFTTFPAHHFQVLTTNGKPIEGKPMK